MTIIIVLALLIFPILIPNAQNEGGSLRRLGLQLAAGPAENVESAAGGGDDEQPQDLGTDTEMQVIEVMTSGDEDEEDEGLGAEERTGLVETVIDVCRLTRMVMIM